MKLFTRLKNKLQKDQEESSQALCPLPQRLDINSLNRVQVFIPHPDDESIGCGGLLALLAQRGCNIQAVLVTDGSGAGELPISAVQARRSEFISALNILGISEYRFLDFPDGNVRSGYDLTRAINDVIKDFKPDSVLMPAVLDLHRDHRVIASEIFKQAPEHLSIEQLIQYEVWCPLPATHIVDITGVAETKWKAISQHETALACGNYLTASEGLARYRALLLGPFGNPIFAEAFVVDHRATFKASKTSWLSQTSKALISRLVVSQ